MALILQTSLDSHYLSRSSSLLTDKERQEIYDFQKIYAEFNRRLHQRIVGLDEIIEELVITILSGGHALLIGVPGLAKTLTIRSAAELLDLQFSRIQFTPDLMPSDITGTELLIQDEDKCMRQFAFLKGPIFANIILADEINRTPPKTQSALLEAMEEHTVTSMGQRFTLESPFFVLATQNPIEQEGTYPLPIAQLDRFMMNLLLDYPSHEEEYRIVRLTVAQPPRPIESLLSKDKILALLSIVKKIEIPPEVMQYAIDLTRMSRPQQGGSSQPFIRDYVAWGTSPRAAQALIVGGKARALLHGRTYVQAQDIRAITHPVMRHRLFLSYQAEADRIKADVVIDKLLEVVPAPDGVKHSRHRDQKRQLALETR